VRDLVELCAYRLDHAAMAVAGVEDGDSAGEVHVAAAFRIPQECVLSPLDEHRVDHGDAARDGSLAPGNQ